MSSLEDKLSGAIYGMFVGDSIAAPLHWYYEFMAPGKIKEHLDTYYNGSLDKLYGVNEEARDKHPTSGGNLKKIHDAAEAPLMALIKDEYKALWATENMHYNATLKAGENTNSVQLAKVLMASLIDNKGEYSAEDFAKRYADYFQKHQGNDLYFGGVIQNFFKQLADGKKVTECGKEGEMDLSGHTPALPLSLLLHADGAAAKAAVKEQIWLLQRADDMVAQAETISELLVNLLNGNGDAKTLIGEAAKKINPDVDLEAIANDSKEKEDAELFGLDPKKDGKPFTIHCYGAPPGLLYLAYKYFDEPAKALIANANLGGDNTDRGSILGAVLGAAKGSDWIPAEWRSALSDPQQADLDSFVSEFVKLAAAKK